MRLNKLIFPTILILTACGQVPELTTNITQSNQVLSGMARTDTPGDGSMRLSYAFNPETLTVTILMPISGTLYIPSQIAIFDENIQSVSLDTCIYLPTETNVYLTQCTRGYSRIVTQGEAVTLSLVGSINNPVTINLYVMTQ